MSLPLGTNIELYNGLDGMMVGACVVSNDDVNEELAAEISKGWGEDVETTEADKEASGAGLVIVAGESETAGISGVFMMKLFYPQNKIKNVGKVSGILYSNWHITERWWFGLPTLISLFVHKSLPPTTLAYTNLQKRKAMSCACKSTYIYLTQWSQSNSMAQIYVKWVHRILSPPIDILTMCFSKENPKL